MVGQSFLGQGWFSRIFSIFENFEFFNFSQLHQFLAKLQETCLFSLLRISCSKIWISFSAKKFEIFNFFWMPILCHRYSIGQSYGIWKMVTVSNLSPKSTLRSLLFEWPRTFVKPLVSLHLEGSNKFKNRSLIVQGLSWD